MVSVSAATAAVKHTSVLFTVKCSKLMYCTLQLRTRSRITLAAVTHASFRG